MTQAAPVGRPSGTGAIATVPAEPGMGNGEVLKQSLADDAGLDEDVVSVKLAHDVVAVEVADSSAQVHGDDCQAVPSFD